MTSHSKIGAISHWTNLSEFAFPDLGLLLGKLLPSSSAPCLKAQSGPLSHLPLMRKSKHTPLKYWSLAPSLCWKWHFSPRSQEPEDRYLKHSLLPSLSPCFCRFWEVSYRQYCESEAVSLDLFGAPSVVWVAFSTDENGNKVVFVVFMPISEAAMIDAGVGDIACKNFWAGARTKCYKTTRSPIRSM